jgi:hypothetical protein
MKREAAPLGYEHVARRSASLIDTAFGANPKAPIDPFSLAEAACVKWLQFRPLPIEGGLTPIDGGFDVCINHSEMTPRAAPLAHSSLELSTRQRFTLAHEISHTFFYDVVPSHHVFPRELEGTPVARRVEIFCNYGARAMLLPMPLVSRELDRIQRPIDFAMAERLSNRFQVSTEVCIRRLNDYAANKSLDSAILMVHEGSGRADAVILAAMTSPSILKYVPKRPVPYDKLEAWGKGFLPQRFWAEGCSEVKAGNGVCFRRIRNPSFPEQVFIQVTNLLAAG